MQLKKITPLTEVYAVSLRGTDLSHTYPGVIVSTTPYRRREHGNRDWSWTPEPEGTGYGRGVGYRLSERGLLVVRAERFDWREEAEVDHAGMLAAAATLAESLALTPEQHTYALADVPEGFRVDVVSPRQVLDTWGAKLAHDTETAAERKAARAQRIEHAVAQHAAETTLRAVLGESARLPFRTWDPTDLLAFAEAYHAAKLAQAADES